MKLNRIEKWAMNNPVREFIQRGYEARILRRLGGPVPGGDVLEIGCGRGVGTEIILDGFDASRVTAIDLDDDMAAKARKRLAPRGDAVSISTGDASALEFADASFDAVFDFGIIHHIPDWRAALREIHRVLRPGGRFYCEEVLSAFLQHPLVRISTDHPEHDRFSADAFTDGLHASGFTIVARRELREWFAWFIAEKSSK